MPFEKGTRLGPYEILSPIGAGGMGEVYLATDTRLNRRVAIKVLPPQWASDPDMKVRFEREARIIGNLSHPHICTLHDIGRELGADYLVMEFLEGETLAERIARGPLPVEEAVRISAQIADALDKAHREGVTHRDLKPGNVMLTKSGVKLLDFGLARENASAKPSMETRLDVTMRGAIVGTMQYMAPEQLEGREVTPQTDIFAFGAVLYEMLTGKKAFTGDSQAGLISAIMTAAPPSISVTQKIDSPALEYAVKRCLEKDPTNRWQSARDLMDHLQWAVQGNASPAVVKDAHARRHLRLVAALSALSALLAMLLVVFALTRPQRPPPAAEIRFLLEAEVAGASLAVSPDGRWIAYSGREKGSQTRFLFLRAMGSTTSQKIAGTEDALAPFWSPRNDRIGFFSGNSLKAVAISGGVPEIICPAQGTNRAGTWNWANVIVFASDNVLNRVDAGGGKPEPLTTLNVSRAEVAHTLPSFLPGGEHFLFLVLSQQDADDAIYLGGLNSKEPARLISLRSMAAYSSGHLLYVDDGALVARPFDPDSQTFQGEPFRLVNGADPAFSVSDSGVLLYRPPAPSVIPKFQYSWVDRSGRTMAIIGQPEHYFPYWDLSADAKQAAVTRVDVEASNMDIEILDLERGILSKVTTDAASEADPRWSPDGLRVAYTTQKKGNRDVFERNASGLGEETELLNSSDPETLDDWSSDGRYVIYRTGANTNTIFALPLFGDRKPFPVVASEFNKDGSQLSPDSKWLAYNAVETGMSQVYVVSFPTASQKRQISTNGGTQPRWRQDGKELYFLSNDGKMMAVDISTEPTLSSGAPRQLFETGVGRASFDAEEYGVTGDGKRFLLLKAQQSQEAAEPAPRPFTVIVNWTAALRERQQ
jgi:Tol biopolymer transport system component